MTALLEKIPTWFKRTKQGQEMTAEVEAASLEDRQRLVAEREAIEQRHADELPELRKAEEKARAELDKAKAALNKILDKLRSAIYDRRTSTNLRNVQFNQINYRLLSTADEQIADALERLAELAERNRRKNSHHEMPAGRDRHSRKVFQQFSNCPSIGRANRYIDTVARPALRDLQISALGGDELQATIEAIFSAIPAIETEEVGDDL